MQHEKNKIAVFISSGIGNAILVVPLLKLLKQDTKNRVVIILNSEFVNKEFLIFNNFPFDEIITCKNKDLWKRSYFQYFDKTYLDYSSSSVKNLILASFISKKTYSYKKNKLFLPKVKYLKAGIDIHASVLHARMINSTIDENNFSLDLMRLIPQKNIPKLIKKIKKQGQKILTVQISSGNNKTKYKDWPINYWIDFLKKILNKYSGFHIILLGDKNEIYLGRIIKQKITNDKIISMIGKTTLEEAGSILNHSDIYIGLDSAFMHLAVAYDIPTFTILGASSEQFIGYHKFDDKKHFVIFKDLFCRPCHTWIGANTAKTKTPEKCADFMCLVDLKPEKVFKEFSYFISQASDIIDCI